MACQLHRLKKAAQLARDRGAFDRPLRLGLLDSATVSKKSKKRQPPVAPKASWLKRVSGLGYSMIGGVVLFLGIVPTIWAYHPNITVSAPTEPVEAANPFSEEFTITNQSFFTLHNVNFLVGMCQSIGTAAPPSEQPFKNGCSAYPKFALTAWKGHMLKQNESYTVPLAALWGTESPNGIRYADITLIVEYTPALFGFWQREAHFRFVTRKSPDGNIHWEGRPESD